MTAPAWMPTVRFDRWVAIGYRAIEIARQTEITFLAAAIAYYGLVSLVPALVLALAIASAVGGAALAELAFTLTQAVVNPSGQAVIEDALLGTGQRGGATLLGVVVLGWGALKGFRGLDRAFSRVYGTSADLSFGGGLRNTVVGLVGVGAAFALMVGLGGTLAALSVPVAGWILGLLVLLVGLFTAFLPIYVRFPSRPVGLREAAPGAALAAAGWVTLQAGFQLYASFTSVGDLYGVLGGALLLVTWFYLAAILVLLGAVLNVALVEGDRQAEEPGEPGNRPGMARSDDADRSLEADITALREAVEALETRLEEHTVRRSEVESDLRRYVRSRVRRGHARGWGPYLVLLYGTAMTVGAFYFLSGGWAILAMVVVWLSTLGLYVLMVLAGVAFGVIDVPGKAVDALRDRRS